MDTLRVWPADAILRRVLSSEFVHTLLDSAPDAIVVIDASGKILSVNKQVTALFGYSRGEIEGQRVEQLLPDRFRDRHVSHRTNYGQAVRVRPMGMGLELFGMRKDGTEFPVEISLSPIPHDGQTLVAAAIRDVTERKRVERALQEARREADHANQAKSRFLATASHDLRQPLQTLGLLTGTLRRMIDDADCLEVISEQEIAVEGMSRLLNALLDVSKLESGAIRPDIVDFPLSVLMDELRREFAGMAASKGLRLSIDTTLAQAHSDPALVGQVLRNLVSNAIKYTPRGWVEVRCRSEGPGSLRIAVRDSGIGIAEDQIGLIYDEFYQVGVAPNATRDGYGLGLSIVQRITRLLDIQIEVRSKLGEGSEFSFVLPATMTQPAPSARPQGRAKPEESSGPGHRILLVEDEAGVRNAMKMLLNIEGHSVVAAATCREAVAALRAGLKVDLVVTDYHLEEGHTGSEVIATARETLGSQIGAVLVSGDTSSAIRALRDDAKLRITSKPINSDELLRMIRSLLPE
jgi:two-component system, sensor histidine kinase